MKLSNSSGFSFVNNHPTINVKPVNRVVKFDPEHKPKLIVEKRNKQSNKP